MRLLAAGNDPLLDDSLGFARGPPGPGVTVNLRVLPDTASLRGATLPAMAGFMATQTPGGQAVPQR